MKMLMLLLAFIALSTSQLIIQESYVPSQISEGKWNETCLTGCEIYQPFNASGYYNLHCAQCEDAMCTKGSTVNGKGCLNGGTVKVYKNWCACFCIEGSYGINCEH